MHHIPLILKGIIIGFSIAAPIGPVGILCIRRTLKRGRLSGFITGLGTATIDAIYAIIAIFSITLIGDFLLRYKDILQAFAVLFLIFLGHSILFEHKYTFTNKLGKKNLFSDFISTVMITGSNPMTIFGLAAIFTSLNIPQETMNSLSIMMIVIGVFFGSTLWWLILSTCVKHIGKRMNTTIINKINKIAGICLILFGVILMGNLVFGK